MRGIMFTAELWGLFWLMVMIVVFLAALLAGVLFIVSIGTYVLPANELFLDR